MAKGEGRGIHRWIPSIYLAGKVLLVLVALKLINRTFGGSVPTSVQPFWPVV